MDTALTTSPEAPEADRSPAGDAPFGLGSAVPDKAPEMPEQSLPFGQPEGSTGVPGNLRNFQKDWQSGDSGLGTSAKPGKWDKFLGGLQQGYRGSFMGTLAEKYQAHSAETGTMLTPEEANALNPYRGTPYTTPVDSGIVAMESADARRQQQLDEWLGRNESGNFMKGVGSFGGALADAPMYMALGLLTGGVGDLAVGGAEAVGGRALGMLARYGYTVGEFSTVGELQNKLESSMGAKEKPLYQVVQESLGPAALATGIHAAFRAYLDRGDMNPNQLEGGVKKNVAAMANDELPPEPPGSGGAAVERKAGVQLDPSGDRVTPTIKTSPLEETKLYAATHADGTPLIHEHGLGPGSQFTDSHEVANNGVSKSSSIPGQIGETKLPDDAKLINLDTPAQADYESKNSLLKAIEEKTGVPLDAAVKDNPSIKDVIKNLGDYAGVELSDGKKIPDDILEQVQQIAKDKGYSGYQFADQNSRQVHMFDAKEAGMQISNVEHANPDVTPEDPTIAKEPKSPEEIEAAQKQKAMNYSPNLQAALEKIRKTAMTLHPENLGDQIQEAEKILTEHKQALSQLAKNNPLAEADLTELRELEAHDKRMLDVAKRIMDCGASE